MSHPELAGEVGEVVDRLGVAGGGRMAAAVARGGGVTAGATRCCFCTANAQLRGLPPCQTCPAELQEAAGWQ